MPIVAPFAAAGYGFRLPDAASGSLKPFGKPFRLPVSSMRQSERQKAA
jgi:hypothetical protein